MSEHIRQHIINQNGELMQKAIEAQLRGYLNPDSYMYQMLQQSGKSHDEIVEHVHGIAKKRGISLGEPVEIQNPIEDADVSDRLGELAAELSSKLTAIKDNPEALESMLNKQMSEARKPGSYLRQEMEARGMSTDEIEGVLNQAAANKGAVLKNMDGVIEMIEREAPGWIAQGDKMAVEKMQETIDNLPSMAEKALLKAIESAPQAAQDRYQRAEEKKAAIMENADPKITSTVNTFKEMIRNGTLTMEGVQQMMAAQGETGQQIIHALQQKLEEEGSALPTIQAPATMAP